MREWPNRTVSKTVVPHGYRGFESHSLRHRVESARRIPDESLHGRTGVLSATPGRRYDRKGVTVARARSTFGKLQRDQAKKDRARAKMDDRLSRREDKAADGPEVSSSNGEAVDQTRLLEQFAALHEDLADGRISLDDFEVRQEELRSKMVVE